MNTHASPKTSSGAFQKLEGAKATKMIERVNATWPGSPFDATKTALFTRPMGFLSGWQLVEVSDATALPEKRCVVMDNGKDCVLLQYDAAFIQEFCRKSDLRLDRHTASDYLRFWFEYVRTGAERFMLVESVDDMPWREDPTPQARKSLAKSIAPLTLLDSTPALFQFHACLLFRDALLDARIDLTYDGKITIVDRNVIVEDLTVTDPFTGF